LRAFLRLEWHFFTTGISGFEAKLRLIRDAVRGYLDRPWIILPASSQNDPFDELVGGQFASRRVQSCA